jgi:large subunit ribosomal protein L21
MYAVVATGGKQYRVEEGQTLRVERLGEIGSDVELRPVLLVDGGDVLSTPDQLSGVQVSARILDEVKGKKIDGFTYKSKTNQRRRYGHRQTYATIEITGIKRG